MDTQDKQVLIAKYNLLYSKKDSSTLYNFCYIQSGKNNETTVALFKRLLKYYNKESLICFLSKSQKRNLRKLSKNDIIDRIVTSKRGMY